MESSIKKRLARGMGWVFAGSVVGKCLGAVCSIIMARVLGPAVFGQYGIVQSTVLMFATYGALRMGNTGVKYVAQYRKSDPAKAARILRLALSVSAVMLGCVAILVIALSPVLSSNVMKSPALRWAFVIGGLYLFFLTYGSILQQSLAGFENFRATASNVVLRNVLALLLCVPFGYFWGLEGALIGLVLSAVGVIPQAVLFLRREERKHGFPAHVPVAETLKEMPVLWQFALPGFLTLATMTGANWLVRVMLSRNHGFSELGVVEAAGQWVSVIDFVPAMLARVVMPMLSGSHGTDARKEYAQTLALQMRTILLVGCPATLLMLGFSNWVPVIYGSGYAETARVLPILLAAGFLRTLNDCCRIVYESKGRQWSALWVYGVWACVLLGTAFVLIPRQGAGGLVVAALVAECSLLALSAAQVHFKLVPGGLTPNALLFCQTMGVLAVAYVAEASFRPVWACVVCTVLAGLSSLPLLFALRRAQILKGIADKLRAQPLIARLGL